GLRHFRSKKDTFGDSLGLRHFRPKKDTFGDSLGLLSKEAKLFVGWVSGSVTHAGVGFHASTQPTF
ncbi:MAG: hypothetical protein PX482_02515, partial [Microcystis sp. M53602_WE12]|nr:hypothetical protein [Microcystis sp. M53602_WE12]